FARIIVSPSSCQCYPLHCSTPDPKGKHVVATEKPTRAGCIHHVGKHTPEKESCSYGESFAVSGAQRRASAAPGSRSDAGAEAGRRRLQALVRRGLCQQAPEEGQWVSDANVDGLRLREPR